MCRVADRAPLPAFRGFAAPAERFPAAGRVIVAAAPTVVRDPASGGGVRPRTAIQIAIRPRSLPHPAVASAQPAVLPGADRFVRSRAGLALLSGWQRAGAVPVGARRSGENAEWIAAKN